jgi:magnesium transporter
MAAGRFFAIAPDKGIEAVADLSEAVLRRQGTGFIWIDYTDPSAADLSPLVDQLGLHPLAIEDCLDEDQVPKMEDFPGNTFILVNRYRCVGDVVAIEEVNFFLGEKMLVSVHSHARSSDDGLGAHLEATVRRNIDQSRRGPDFLLEVILDDIVDEKFAAIEALQDQLDAAEEEILSGTGAFTPGNLIRLRRDLLQIRKSLVHEREILVKLCRRDSPYVSEKAIYHFRDIYDHLAKFFEVIEICRELVASIMEIHLAMVNNQMAMVGNKTNHVVRRLTLITTVFMPLSLLAGIGGMSEWSMMTGPHNWRLAYPAFLLAMVTIGIGNYFLLKWFDARDKIDVAIVPTLSVGDENR